MTEKERRRERGFESDNEAYSTDIQEIVSITSVILSSFIVGECGRIMSRWVYRVPLLPSVWMSCITDSWSVSYIIVGRVECGTDLFKA